MNEKKTHKIISRRIIVGTVIAPLGILLMFFVAAAAPNGNVSVWGSNLHGQLGDGTTISRLTPVLVGGLADIIEIAGGDEHTIALKSDGSVLTWGYNRYGELGDGTKIQRSFPIQVSGLTDIIAIEGGEYHTIILKSDGIVWTWGHNNNGQLGDDTTINRLIPVQVSGLADVTKIAGGYYHTIALKSDGTVWAWGSNTYGQLGDGTTTNKWTPYQVIGLTDVIEIAGGGFHTIALKSDGTVWTWGSNWEGQLGDGTQTDRWTPNQVSGLTDVIEVAGGYGHTIALKSDGTVWTWGRNSLGQVGDNTTTRRLIPYQVIGLTDVIEIAGGGFHTIALKSDGTVWIWGSNIYGQLGDGTKIDRLIPVQVNGILDVSKIAGGEHHTIALVATSATLALKPFQPTNLTQLKSDGSTAITVGGITNERIVEFQGRVSDPDGGNVRLQVELRRTDENNGQFNESLGGLKTSELVANGTIVTVSAIELINGDYHWRARTIDASGNKSEWQEYGGNLVSETDFTVDSQDFIFAHMTDTHYGGESLDKFTDTLQAIKTHIPEFILNTGDVADYSNSALYQGYMGIIQSLSMPVYNIPGNHDSRNNFLVPQEIGLENYNNNIYNPIGITSMNDGFGDYYFDAQGIRFIEMDSGRDFSVGDALTPESTGLNDLQYLRLNEADLKTGPKIIAMHHPVIDEDDDGGIDPVPNNCPQYGGNNGAISSNRCNLITYSLENDVRLILSGHTHKDYSRFFINAEDQRESGFVQTKSATKDRSGYSIVEIQDGDITVMRHSTDSVLSNADRAGYLFENLQGMCYVKKNNKFTGMISYNSIVREIPDTYYTGHLENGQQAIAYYSKNNGEPDDSRCVKNRLIAGAGIAAAPQSALNEFASNITIRHRTENMSIEYIYENVSFGTGENASVGINFSAENYAMEFDNDGDGTVDNTTQPASITTNHAPEISITGPIGSESGNISILYNLRDSESANVSLLAEYSRDNITWIEAAMSEGGDGEVNVTSSSEGINHTYIWQSAADIPVGGGNVSFRIRPLEEEISGNPAATGVFSVLAPLRYIKGAVTESISNTSLAGVTVSIDNITATTNATGYYLLEVPEGTYNLTVRMDPTHYPSVTEISTVGIPEVVQNSELAKKPTGNITGSVRN